MAREFGGCKEYPPTKLGGQTEMIRENYFWLEVGEKCL